MAAESLIDVLLDDARERMVKSTEAAQHEFSTVRTGRASPALLGELRHGQADHLAVVRRCQAEVGLEDRALDLLDRALVVGLDREQPRLGHADLRELV